MAQVDEKKFLEWNEAMSVKHNPDFHHNHPNPMMRFLERRRTNSILRYVDPVDSDRILDVGCGAGNMLERFRQGHLYGVDISNFVLEQAKRRLGDRVVIQRGNAENLPFRSESLDKIFCSEVIEHTLHPEKVVGEIFRVLKKGGLCVMSFPNERFTIALKKLLRKSGIARLILPPGKGEESNLYDVHEWHLHRFHLGLLRELIAGKFELTAKCGNPFSILPVKWIVRLKKSRSAL
jgi:ubiquinone/menaquinone biosynthesis C-methylase UbiE